MEDILIHSFKSFRSTLGERHGRTQSAVRLLIRLYEAWEKPEEAEEWRVRLK